MKGYYIMKAKYLMLVAVLAFTFTACEKQSPYDTQSPDDAPLILIPYESDQTGSVIYVEEKLPEPYVDSVVVTPSAHTTVNWYLDGVLVHTGTKINKCFPAGTYALLIEAVTSKGKKTSRSGKLTVKAAADDPYVSSRFLAPGVTMTVEGKNLDQVDKIILSTDFYGNDSVCTVVPKNVGATQMDVTLPAIEGGTYYLCLLTKDGKIFGSEKLQVADEPVILSGFTSFNGGEEWVFSGANLQDVISVKIGDTVITTLTATATSVSLQAPNLAEGEYTLSMQNQDGSAVLFYTTAGLVKEVKTRASAAGETSIWEGSVVVDWDKANVHLEKSVMANVPAGATVYVYYNVPEATYHALRVVVAPDWSADILPQVDEMQLQANPYSFVYDSTSKALAEADDKNGILVTGHGLEIIQITYR